MEYLTAKQLSEKWGISERRIIKLCKENRITGAEKNGRGWLIPEDTIKPSDKRSKISKYINTQKRVIIININTEIGYSLIPLLRKQGYIVEGFYYKNTKYNKEALDNINIWKVDYNNKNELEIIMSKTNKYYDGLIFINTESRNIESEKFIINEFSKKMNCESSIVIVNKLQDTKISLEKEFAEKFKNEIGLRINAINIEVGSNDVIINYKEIAEDVFSLITNFKNTTGIAITTNGGLLNFDKNGKSELLPTGRFYKAINYYFRNLNRNSYLWCASTMLEDEWTEEPLEMNFRVINLEAANRGVNIDRIFIFSRSKIKEFKNNKTLKIYMQSSINTMFVDYDEIKEKAPQLLEIVGEGWDGIDKTTLICDLPNTEKERGYITTNKKEVMKAYDTFQELKKYSKNLKEILK